MSAFGKAPILHLAAALVVLQGAAWRASAIPAGLAADAGDEDGRQYFAAGANLSRHGILSFDDPTGFGPLRPTADRGILYPTFLAALLADGPADASARLWTANLILGLFVVALTWVTGAILGSPLSGSLAAALVSIEPRSIEALKTLDIQTFYAVIVCHVVLALILWAQRPCVSRSLLAGFMVAISLTCRSTLILFPPLCCLILWTKRRRAAGVLPQLFAFAAASILPLAPWTARNYAWSGRLSPFEMGAANLNILEGSLGFVSDEYQTESGPAGGPSWKELHFHWPRGDLSLTGGVIRSAVRNIAAAPLDYLTSTLLRIPIFWGYWLAPLALVLAWPARDGPRLDRIALAALPLYWNIHILMLCMRRYLVPAVPSLSLLLALFAAPRRAPDPRRLAAGPPLLALFLFPTILYLGGLGFMTREYTRWSADEGVISLLLDQASSAGKTGRREEALAALGRAERLKPSPYQMESVARITQALGEFRLCQKKFEALIGLFPRHAKFLNDAAVCAQRGGRPDAAVRHLRGAIALDPRGLEAYLTLSYIYSQSGEREKARRNYKSAMSVARFSPDLLLRRQIAEMYGRPSRRAP